MLGLADDLIVEAIGKCESDDLNPKLAFQGLLAAINFVMRSRGVILPPRCVPQIGGVIRCELQRVFKVQILSYFTDYVSPFQLPNGWGELVRVP
jgi:hypothetical protein